ncbi:MAG: ChaN family lipoprotein [Pseudomonadota bacterium]
MRKSSAMNGVFLAAGRLLFALPCALTLCIPAWGQAAEQPIPAPPAASSAPAATESKPALVPDVIIKMPEGKVVSFDEMLRDLRHARIVYMGETHVNLVHHDNQLAIIEALQQRVPSVAVGMEMFQRPGQEALDAWTAGKIDTKELLKQSNWEDSWSLDFNYYEPIMEHARQTGEKILALNAPYEIVHKVGGEGIGNLTTEERGQLPGRIDLGKDEHRHYRSHMYENQGPMHHQSSFDRFYEAQRVWDETMAQSITDYFRQPGAAQVLAVIVGNGHVDYGLGIPDDVSGRICLPSRVVAFQEADAVTWADGPGPPVPMFDYGRPLGDYVWLTTGAEAGQRPKLGVVVGEPAEGQTKGVRIGKILPGSPAAMALFQPGDVILTVNGEEVNSIGELKYALSHRKIGDKVAIELSRGGKKENSLLTLSPIEE